jgi:hypothetical protein
MGDPVIAREMGAHGARLDGHDREFKELREDLAEIKRSLAALEEIASMGKGALWTALKIGAAFTLIASGLVWMWEYFGAPLVRAKGGS